MATLFQNSSITSNVLTNVKPEVVSQSKRQRSRGANEVSMPLKGGSGIDLSNKPIHHVDSYVANQKTMVQNMFNAKNLNENLNFKNTFYLEERGELADKEQNTIYGHEKVYEKNVIEAELKAQYALKVWQEKHNQTVSKVKQGFQKTANTVAQKREEKAKTQQAEAAKHVLFNHYKVIKVFRKKR